MHSRGGAGQEGISKERPPKWQRPLSAWCPVTLAMTSPTQTGFFGKKMKNMSVACGKA